MSTHKHTRHLRALLPIVAAALVAIPALWAAAPSRPQPRSMQHKQVVIKPRLQSANRNNPAVVFLERAAELQKSRTDSFLIVKGDVLFRRVGMTMTCDSAHFWPGSQSFHAYGNVRMQQGDTLFVYADSLHFDEATRLATLFAEPPRFVTMINRGVKLETQFTFYYDLGKDLAWYDQWGVLTDRRNRLEALVGEYSPTTKDAVFSDGVVLTGINRNDTVVIRSENLYYNTVSRVAELYSPSEIINRRGTIFTDEAVYNTNTDDCQLFDRSTVVTSDGRTLIADTLLYNKHTTEYTAIGDMVLTDTVRKAILTGQYGYYNEGVDSAYVTGRALMREYSQGDTLYVHGRQIVSRVDSDSTHIATIYPRVRFYRSDFQGLCDSLRFTQADSMLRLYRHPVVWNQQRQLNGGMMEVHLVDSTFDRVALHDGAFSAEMIEAPHYNQLSGKDMLAHFLDGELTDVRIDGNVELVLYPEEADSTINKMVNAESSFLSARFVKRNADMIKMWPETNGTVTPLYLAKPQQYYLPKFSWLEKLRPLKPEDVMTVPDEMDRLMAE